VIEGGHPLPSDGSVRAGRRLLEQARAAGPEDLLLVPVSGGGTALSSLPVDAVDLRDLRTTYHCLLTAGVPIVPANVVRKHLTQVGGGQLAQAAHPADVRALVVSDVVGDDLSTIASGPTVPDPSTYEEAMQVLYRHDLWHDVPASVRDHLADGARGRRPETPDAEADCFESVRTTLIGSNDTALAAARDAAEKRGYDVRLVCSGVEGEARSVATEHVDQMMGASLDGPTCWLWGGEPTVTVKGEGKGGRNQELALSAALALDGEDRRAILLSGGTDGIDGPTDAAGAWATPGTAEAAREAGLDPRAHLEDNDAYSFFEALDQLLRPGPTHTNVMDVHVGLVDPRS
jgi:hydroxypyruvate reductase